jgi:hypothetical protein
MATFNDQSLPHFIDEPIDRGSVGPAGQSHMEAERRRQRFGPPGRNGAGQRYYAESV